MSLYYDLIKHIAQQQRWSRETFGPPCERGYEGVVDHLRKELQEIEDNPFDLEEWIDVITLAIDGAWRTGHDPQEIAKCLSDKLEKNKKRDWPNWRTQPAGKAIEHIKAATPSR